MPSGGKLSVQPCRGTQSFCELHSQAHDFLFRQLSPGQTLTERRPLNVLHHQIVHSLLRVNTSSAAASGGWRAAFVVRAAGTAIVVATIFGVVGLISRFAWFGSGPTVVSTRRVSFKGQLGMTVCCPPENYDSIQTDGRRIYYTVGNSLRYVSVNGGDEGHLPLLPSIHNPAVLHISPDGSTLLVKEIMTASGGTESPIWLVATDGSSARKLGDIEAHDAAWAPDGGTIAFAEDQDLYLTDVNGNTPVKLTSTSGRAFWLRWSPDGGRLRFTVLDPKTLGLSLWELKRDRPYVNC